MNVAPDAPKRPALRYYGGKWNLAPWIISHFPPHQNYVELCTWSALHQDMSDLPLFAEVA